MKISKSVKNDLHKLPLQKRLQFMEETRRAGNLSMLRMDRSGRLTGLFIWIKSKRGHDYWAKTFGWVLE